MQTFVANGVVLINLHEVIGDSKANRTSPGGGLSVSGVTASTAVDLQKRVIGGRNCGPTERLYHVEVRDYAVDIGFGLCGGSLIGDRWILTAAHCWDQTRIMRAVLGIHPGDKATLEEITPHFFFDDQGRLHDIMLLKLTNPTKIKPVPLPDCDRNPLNIDDRVEMAGYASTTMGPNNIRQPGRAAVLQCANITVVNCSRLRECLQTNYPGSYAYRQYQDWHCYQSPGVDTSPGDSGGGVMFNDMIYGVHVNTGNHTHACVEAAGFMDVCSYMGWIEKTTGIARPEPERKSRFWDCLNCFKG
ncbi:anionic trypsin-1-like [Sebastes umbrosus]|uniref:anionic trypsin-1-like n=1 Tax=Sebastes umbrosus TaxID=72105 RepID=UPI00189CBA73|nr:anionic trypsin-1-like [Sebastes umbrosus]